MLLHRRLLLCALLAGLSQLAAAPAAFGQVRVQKPSAFDRYNLIYRLGPDSFYVPAGPLVVRARQVEQLGAPREVLVPVDRFLGISCHYVFYFAFTAGDSASIAADRAQGQVLPLSPPKIEATWFAFRPAELRRYPEQMDTLLRRSQREAAAQAGALQDSYEFEMGGELGQAQVYENQVAVWVRKQTVLYRFVYYRDNGLSPKQSLVSARRCLRAIALQPGYFVLRRLPPGATGVRLRIEEPERRSGKSASRR